MRASKKISGFLGIIATSWLWAAPVTFTYQKKLQDKNTGRLIEGTRSVRISFWNAVTGGTRLGAGLQLGTIPEGSDTYPLIFTEGVFHQVIALPEDKVKQVFSDSKGEVWIQIEDLSYTPPATYPRERYSLTADALSVSSSLEKGNSTETLNTASDRRVLTRCPNGFVLVSGKEVEKPFCISASAEPAADWISASSHCYQKDNQGGLCTASEWSLACKSGLKLGMSNAWEWVADLYAEDYAYVMVLAGCTSATTNLLGNSYPSRCCIR